MNGRVILALSLSANLGLLGWLGLQLSHRFKPPPKSVAKVAPRTVSSPAPAHSPSQADLPPARPGVFRWSQVESADYPAYIANLRAIGAPEKTIRDIILADVKSHTNRVLKRRRKKTADSFSATPNQGKN